MAVAREFSRIGVVGLGTMGAGIAEVLARSGLDVVAVEQDAESAERAHIDRVLNPERARATADVVAPKRKEKTIREHAVTFLATYKPDSKPSEKRTKKWVLEARLLPYFGEMTIGDLDQPTVDGFVAAELDGRSAKTVNNRLAVLSKDEATPLRSTQVRHCRKVRVPR